LEFGKIGETIGSENRRSGGVKYRIAIWASAGFLVAGCWGLYFARASNFMPIEPIVNTLIRLTCPVVNAAPYLVSLSLYSILVANAATYALVGLVVEILRQRLNHPS
jgi:hypothetical protein